MIALTALAWFFVCLVMLTVLIWLSRHIEISREGRLNPPLTPTSFPAPNAQNASDWPMISVLVAAKDEEAVIEKCVRSMLDQDYPNYEVILINDRSGDRTGQIGDALARENPRLRTLHVKELKEGWFGKNNAMRLGIEAARGQWFCFIDADCTQTSRSTLSQAFQYARKLNVEFLSVLPRLIAHGFWEQVLQPVCGGILVFWFKPQKVNNPAHPAGYANGAFMLMDKNAYWRIGGHEPVKTEVNEDIHMAQLAKQAGVRLRVVQNEGLYVTRMYEGFRATWRGWSRIFYGSFVRRRRLVISLLVMLLMGVTPYVTAIAGWLSLALGAAGTLPWLAAIAGTASILAQQSVLWRFFPMAGIPRRFTPTYAIGAVVALGIFVNAIRKVGGRSAVTWRGTTYMGNKVKK
ncbi:MAG: glycosyltransferase [Phycisphaerae bacterium]|nr:glycosyltransferase [Phycisphaerae bacterium]